MRTPVLFLSATALLTATVADAQVQRLDPREVAKASQQHAELVAEFGGAETGARGAYVDSVGRRVAAYSGVINPGQSFRFTALNSAVENAFAVPGGYVYITRQLMGLMNDEAELAFVVGHETGHIAANHARAREQASRRNSVLGVLGAILGSVVGGGFGNVIAQGAQVSSKAATLGFSRNQEYEADRLGIRYITAAGYDPQASVTMLAALGRATALEARVQGRGSRKTPEWASTHPLNENRVAQASQMARATGRAGAGLHNRDAFLAQLNGVYVDDDPAQGVIDGRTFTHPDLRLQFSVPVGFLMQNSTDAVSIEGSSGQAEFSTQRFNGNVPAYMQAALNDLTGGRSQVQMGNIQQTQVNGIPAAYSIGRANTSGGAVDIGIFMYQFSPTQAYHFITLTRAGAGLNPFTTMINSVRRITPAEAAAIRPRIIRIHTVARGDTVASLASQMAYRDYRTERFMSLNGLTTGTLVPGQKVKLVVYGARRS